MAEAIVSALLEQLTSTTVGTGLGRSSSSSVENEVGELTDNFRAIQAVLKDAAEKQVKDKVVRLWVDDLKDTSYDIEDALHEWNTAIRELQMKEAKVKEDASKLLKKVSSLTSSLCSDSRQAHQLHRIATRIKVLNERVGAIAKEIDYFDFSSRDTESITEPMTDNFGIDSSEVHGRDIERNRLLDLLLSESSQDQESTPSTISIVGMGGIGKTTLAKLAYNHDKVSTHFGTKIWASVTNHFDEIEIAKAIIESLLGGGEDLVQVVDVLQCVHQSIAGKRFLIVLDDVWIEDPKCWEGLNHCLNCDSQGSRILVTMRKQSTAEAMGSTSTISLGRLSDDECFSIFRRVAFREMTTEEHENFEDIGRKIASKCRGLPLVVMTLGGHLCSHRNIAEWGKFLSSEFWELKEVERDIFPSLLLSYYDLPHTLKKCFLYCAIFPKDYYITKEELIKLWMAQGYLDFIEEEDKQVNGEKYFDLLAKHFFFQDVERNEYNEIIGCKMGDIMHGLAKFLMKNDCATVEFDDLGKSQLDCYKGARHLLIIGKSITTSFYSRGRLLSNYQEKNLLSIYKKEQLRSLVFESRIGCEVDLSKLFDNLTCLRTLNLSGCSNKNILGGPAIKKFRERIKKSIHLRYLNLSHNAKVEGLLEVLWELCNLQFLDLSNCSIGKIQGGIKKLMHLRFLNLSHNEQLEELPEMLCDLYNLQILDVSNCYRLEKLPHEIEKLINLRRLRNHGTSLSYMPKGLQKLTSLQHLSKFAVSKADNDQKACTLECLADFKHLGGFLMITGLGNIRDLVEVNKGILEDKENILCLGLRFDGWMYDEDKVNFELIKPPPNLEELMIEYYVGKTMPLDWIMPLTTLRVLKLSSCFEFEELPPLGRLASLESLYLWKMASLKRVGKEFLGKEIHETSSSSSSSTFVAFPKLKDLTIWNMEEWEEWDYDIKEDEDITIMPAIHSLKLFSCPKLKTVPSHIFLSTTLKKLDVDSCPCIKSSEDLKPPPKSEELMIQYYVGKSMPVSWIKSLANMKVLKLSSFSELEDLPALGQLLSLESLSIWNMETLKKVGNEFLRDKKYGAASSYSSFTAFPKLKYLTIENMEEWEEWDYDIKEDEDITIMPALHALKLHSCSKLKALPDHIFQSTTLKLDIYSCPLVKSSEDLKPHQKPEELTVKYYVGKSIPVSWFKSLANLKVLNLWSCSELEDLPALGELLSLESLSIRSMTRVKKVGNRFLHEENSGKSSSSSSFTEPFPKLKYLTIENMKGLEEWEYDIEVDGDITIMPALLSLKVHSCPKLKAVPDHIFQSTALKELDTESCPCIQISPNSEKFMIQYYMGKSIPVTWFKSSINLKVLNLCSCSELEDLPALGELLSLESLNIWNMASLKKLSNQFLREENDSRSSLSSSFTAFPKLKYLTIENMKEWEEWDYDIKEDENITIMPALLSLKVHSCPKLKTVTGHIFQSPTLNELDIKSCPCIQISPKSEKLTIQYYIGKSIPVSWFKLLANLKVLNLWSCSELEELPALGELLSLESLSIQNMASVKKVGNRFLREENDGKSFSSSSFIAFPKLKYFTIENMIEWEEWAYDIKEEEVKTIMPALFSLKLHSCPKLKRVTDHIFRSTALKELDTDTCPRIQIYSKSEKLTIQYYLGKSIPVSWFKSLANLKVLNLWSCSELEDLPTLGELLSLESLSIQNMACVKKVDTRFLREENDCKSSSSSSFTAFPKLKYLTIENMIEWEEWDYEIKVDEDITIMPALLSLKIHSCPKLKRVTDHIFQSSTVNELNIDSCPCIEIFSKSEKLMIQYYMGKSIPISWFKSLANLKVLNLWSCSKLEDLPALGELLSLESLSILNMASVKKVDDQFLLEENDGKSFSSLSFTAFPKLQSLTFGKMKEWEWWDYGSVPAKFITMPVLHSLKIYSCPNLHLLPSHFCRKPTLQKLKINGCPRLEERYEKEWHKFHYRPNINNSHLPAPHDIEEIEDNQPTVSGIPEFPDRNDAESLNSEYFVHTEIEVESY